MTPPREPAAFRVDPVPAKPVAPAPREPMAMSAEDRAVVVPAAVDPFDAEAVDALSEPPPATPLHRPSRWWSIFVAAGGILLSLALGLWTDQLIRDLYQRAEWLGWFAAALAAAAGLALIVMLAREALALRRLASVAKLQSRAAEALLGRDTAEARRLVDDVALFVAAKPETAAGRRLLDELRRDVVDGPDLIRLAETELMAPLDARARTAVLNAAKRVSVVTAVSPRALVDVAYVIFESARLIRRLSEIYGGRPGTLGFFRLARSVLAHLAVTGSLAAGDALVQQLVGQGLAARLSARLGEGVVNGMMTARIGLAAMETVRPMPFSALRRPGLSDMLRELTRFATSEAANKSKPEK